jgi:hypothetical protein
LATIQIRIGGYLKYLLFAFSLFLGAQVSRASVVYSFTTQPVGKIAPFTFSFDESTFLTKTTIIPGAALKDVSGVPSGFNLSSIVISYFGPIVTITENLNKGLPISFVFNNGPWNAPGTYDSLLDISQITISDPGPAVPEPAECGLVLIGLALLTSYWRRGTNSSQKSRS